ncbi:MAG: hypothetical protein WCS01_11065 [bacterium]
MNRTSAGMRRSESRVCCGTLVITKMLYLEKMWDFAYGVILIAGMPLVTFCGVGEVLERLARVGWLGGWRDDIAFPVLITCGVSALIGGIIIRKRKRVLPLWVLPIEAIIGAVIGLAFLCLIAMVSFFANAG